MSRQEKHAWFNLLVLAFALLIFFILIPLLGMIPAWGAAFGLSGLCGLGVLFYKKKPGKKEVVFDERDKYIQRISSIIAYSVFWILFVLTCTFLWVSVIDTGTVSPDVFPMMIFGGIIVVTLVQSVSTLIMYKKGR